MKSILLKGGSIFDDDGNLVKKDLLVSDGMIKKISDSIKKTDAEFIECDGLIIFPGVFDPHVHFRDFEQTHKECWETGSLSALHGGVTSVIDMPNNVPAILSRELLEKKRDAAKKSYVNYGFNFGSAVDNIPEIVYATKESDVASVKVFMDATTGNMLIDNKEILEEIFKINTIISVHAEGKNLEYAVELAKKYKRKLYLCHVSTKEEIEFLKDNKEENIYVEVTPHHLYFNYVDYSGGKYMMKPELKSREDVDALWDGIKEGIVDGIGSDHAPHTIDEKDSDKPPYGVPGVQTLLPFMLNSVSEGLLSYYDVFRLCCNNSYKFFNVIGRGEVKEGYIADITIVDPNYEKEMSKQDICSKCGWSPFEGTRFIGWPRHVIVNGVLMIKDFKKLSDHRGKALEFSKEGL